MTLLARLVLVLAPVLALVLGSSAPLRAQSADDTPPPAVDFAWCGTFDATAFAGFQPTHRLAPRGVLDLTATVDLDTLFHWRGASFVAQYYAFGGRNGSRILGDYEGFSGIDADPFAHAGEVSLDVEWIPERLRSRIGRLDANSDFALPVSTELFQHSSAGLSGAIFPMPTYPNPEPGIVGEYHVRSALSLTAGVFAGPEPVDVGEPMLSPGRMWLVQAAAGSDSEDSRIVVGAYRHTGRFAREGAETTYSEGWFVVAEQVTGRVASGRELVASMQASFSQARVAPVSQHVAVGLRLRRLTHRRERDAMGIRLSLAELTGPSRQAGAPDEQVVELFHRFALNGWLALQPDLQIIRVPAGDGQRTRTAFTMRLVVER